jgi:hypothetical protein
MIQRRHACEQSVHLGPGLLCTRSSRTVSFSLAGGQPKGRKSFKLTAQFVNPILEAETYAFRSSIEAFSDIHSSGSVSI